VAPWCRNHISACSRALKKPGFSAGQTGPVRILNNNSKERFIPGEPEPGRYGWPLWIVPSEVRPGLGSGHRTRFLGRSPLDIAARSSFAPWNEIIERRPRPRPAAFIPVGDRVQQNCLRGPIALSLRWPRTLGPCSERPVCSCSVAQGTRLGKKKKTHSQGRPCRSCGMSGWCGFGRSLMGFLFLLPRGRTEAKLNRPAHRGLARAIAT